MTIVLLPNRAYSLREQMRRLWRRNPPQAVWLGSNIAAAAVLWFLLTVGLPVAGTYLTFSEGCVWFVLCGVIIALIGVPLGVLFRRRAQPVLLSVGDLLVREAAATDQEDRAQTTKIEREAIEELREELATVRQLAQEAKERSDATRLREARERWQNVHQSAGGRLSRRNIPQRLQVVADVLQGGSVVEAEDVPLHADVARGIAGETDEALARVLAGKPVSIGASMWPGNYNADPDALRK